MPLRKKIKIAEIAQGPINTDLFPIVEIDGLCKMLNIGKNTAYNLLISGEIDAFKVGSVWKIPTTSVNEYIRRKCYQARLSQMYTLINYNRDLFFEHHGVIPLKFVPHTS